MTGISLSSLFQSLFLVVPAAVDGKGTGLPPTSRPFPSSDAIYGLAEANSGQLFAKLYVWSAEIRSILLKTNIRPP